VAKAIKPWKQLTPAYRKRLQRAGITAADRRRGVDLRETRGHTPRSQAPRPLITGSIAGTLTEVQRAARRLWRETLSPDWLPSRQNMSDGTAAALSQLRHPRTWRRVDFTPAPPGQPWRMRVTYTRGYQEIELPPDLYREVLDLLALVQKVNNYTADDSAWNNYIERGRDYDVHGTP
jgi:hypothetical protein